MLLVGNHSGGNLTPDTMVFTLAFCSPLRRRAALLPARPQPRARPLPYGQFAPQVRHRRRLARERRSEALDAGAALLVYPGGDWEVHRPSWEQQQGRLRRPQGLHQAGPDRGRPDRPGGLGRRPGDGALPQPRRPARPQRFASTSSSGSRCCRSRSRRPGASTSATSSATSRCRRSSRSRSCARSSCASDSAATPTSTRSTTTSPRTMQRPSTSLAAERRLPVIG